MTRRTSETSGRDNMTIEATGVFSLDRLVAPVPDRARIRWQPGGRCDRDNILHSSAMNLRRVW